MNAERYGDTMNANGMNWCRQDLRLAIYLRDGAACVWCGASIEDGAQLTLDHLTPRESGGGNEPSNLVTACHLCNSRRGKRSVEEFAEAVAGYVDHGVTALEILLNISRLACQDIKSFRAEAKVLIARRGSAARALNPTTDTEE